MVDDGSTDHTAELISGLSTEKFEYIRGSGQWWWTRCLNEGLRAAFKAAKVGDYILTLNNDVHFSRDYLATLVEISSRLKRPVLGSGVREEDGKGHSSSSFGFLLDYRRGGIEPVLTSTASVDWLEVDSVSTRGTLFPVELFKSIGFFDQAWLPHHGSDVDFARRAKKKGFPVFVQTRAMLAHLSPNDAVQVSFLGRVRMLLDRRSSCNLRTRFILSWRFSASPMAKVLNFIRVLKQSLFYISGFSE